MRRKVLRLYKKGNPMLTNYLKIALRTLWHNKLFSLVTIIGLSVSMAVGIGLLHSLNANFDTDHFHPYLDRTYRIITDVKEANGQTRWATTPQPIAQSVGKLSMVEKLVQVRNGGPVRMMTKNGEIMVSSTFTEPSFFDVFGFSLLSGNARTALQSPTSVLLSKATALRIFGSENSMGQLLMFDGLGLFTVAGIIAEPPLRTHLPVEAVFSLQAARSLEKTAQIPTVSDKWADYKTTATYALLHSRNDQIAFNQALSQITPINQPAGLKQSLTFSAQPIEDITPWNPAIRNDMHAGMNWSGIGTYLFLIAALTLLAAFNYTSLSLARALSRAKEVGIRKASGALRGQIFGQFLTESTLIALVSLGLAFVFWQVAVSSGWLPKSTAKMPELSGQLIGWLLIYALLTGLVAGLIPARLLSGFQPVQVLKSLQTYRLFRGVGFYRLLIVIQFAVTTMLMIFVVVLQGVGLHTEEYLADKLPNNVVLLSLRGESEATLTLQLEQLSQVRKVTATNQIPVYSARDLCTLRVAGASKVVASSFIDHNYVSVFGLKLRAGQNLPANLSAKKEQYVLINETLARQLPGHTPEKAVGQLLQYDSTQVNVAGVLVDPTGELNPSQATIYRYKPDQANLLAIQVQPGQEAFVIEASQRIWQQNVPNRVPDIQRYDQKIQHDFLSGYSQLNVLFRFFCGLVLLVACLGILGISAYAVDVRTREIGIRRTLGARHREVVWTISKTFASLFLWAGLFGIPAGWFCGKLLHDRMTLGVDLGPVNLLIGFGLVVLVGSLTILSQTIRTIWINPANVLRSE